MGDNKGNIFKVIASGGRQATSRANSIAHPKDVPGSRAYSLAYLKAANAPRPIPPPTGSRAYSLAYPNTGNNPQEGVALSQYPVVSSGGTNPQEHAEINQQDDIARWVAGLKGSKPSV